MFDNNFTTLQENAIDNRQQILMSTIEFFNRKHCMWTVNSNFAIFTCIILVTNKRIIDQIVNNMGVLSHRMSRSALRVVMSVYIASSKCM